MNQTAEESCDSICECVVKTFVAPLEMIEFPSDLNRVLAEECEKGSGYLSQIAYSQ